MKIILLQNVKNVGQKGEVKEVSEGFARNHLFPRNLAKAGTEQTLREVKKLSQDKANHQALEVSKIKETFESLSNQIFVFNMKATEQGALFAKFEEKNLLEYLHKKEYKKIELKHITIVGSPIKHTGDYTVVLKEKNITSTFTISIQK
jgi:large subunit ribosomal protein L9